MGRRSERGWGEGRRDGRIEMKERVRDGNEEVLIIWEKRGNEVLVEAIFATRAEIR